MKISPILVGLIGLFCTLLLCGCETPLVSSAGTVGPRIPHALPKQQNILILSTLRDSNVDVISENIFSYQSLGSTSIPAHLLNSNLSLTLQNTLQKNGYNHLQIKTLDTHNVLSDTDIQAPSKNTGHIPSRGSLTADAQKFLAAQVKGKNIDTIVILTQTGNHALNFDIRCEQGKDNRFYHATLLPHLYFYRIYIINAHNLQILGWMTGSASEQLPDVRLCKPLKQYQPKDFTYLNSMVIEGLNKSVATDLPMIQ